MQNGNFLFSFSCVYSLPSIVSKSFTFSLFISMSNNRIIVHSMGYYLWLSFKNPKSWDLDESDWDYQASCISATS